MKNFFKQLFCKHEFEEGGLYDENGYMGDSKECPKCGLYSEKLLSISDRLDLAFKDKERCLINNNK